VRDYLTQAGMAASAVTAKDFDKTQPVAFNAAEEGGQFMGATRFTKPPEEKPLDYLKWTHKMNSSPVAQLDRVTESLEQAGSPEASWRPVQGSPAARHPRVASVMMRASASYGALPPCNASAEKCIQAREGGAAPAPLDSRGLDLRHGRPVGFPHPASLPTATASNS